MSVIPDSDFGARVRSACRTRQDIWFTTVAANGTPQPNPVWFLWEPDDDAVLIYNATNAKRLDHVAVRPRVSLNFDSDEHGDNVVVMTGVAEQALDVPPAERARGVPRQVPRRHASSIGMDREKFAETTRCRCVSG